MKLVPLPHRFISFAGHLSAFTKRQALLAQMSVVKVRLGSKQSLAPDLSGLSRESHLSIRAVSAQLMKSGAAEHATNQCVAVLMSRTNYTVVHCAGRHRASPKEL